MTPSESSFSTTREVAPPRKYYSRLPIANFLFSRALFAALSFRRRFLQFKHALRAKSVCLSNDAATRDQLTTYLEQGITKLNLGGGRKNFDGFVNVDFVRHPGVSREIVANVLDLTFVPDSSLDQVHSNHFLEHLTLEDVRHQLHEYQRILKPRGIVTARFPNALGVCYGFFFGATPEQDHDDFVRLGFPATESFADPGDGWYVRDLWAFYHWIWGETGNVENEHLSRWTPSAVRSELLRAGFEVLRMADPECSNIVVIAQKPERAANDHPAGVEDAAAVGTAAASLPDIAHR